MSKTSVYWNVLSLTGNREVIEIVSSLIQGESLGCIDTDDFFSIFFESGKKNKVNNLISNLNQLHDFDFDWTTQEIEPWHLSWKDNFNPIYVRDKIAIIPDWEELNLEYEHVVKIKPGMAFGTGHHETTFLMLEALLKFEMLGKSLLDLGTGSGILAFTAKSLGAVQIIGVEHDEVCEENFMENMDLNNVSDIDFIQADATTWMNFNFDVVLANINRNVLLEIIPNLKMATGIIVLSGILTADEKIMRQICNDNGLNVNEVNTKGEWISMELIVA